MRARTLTWRARVIIERRPQLIWVLDGLEAHEGVDFLRHKMHPSRASINRLLCIAIAERRLVTFFLDGFRRIAEPHDYGIIDGVARLFFYQIGGESRSGRPVGWRWGVLPRISQLHILRDIFPGPRPAPSGRHIRWDTLIATVSPRPVSPQPCDVVPSMRGPSNNALQRTRHAQATKPRR